MDALNLRSGDRVIDVGCGLGSTTRELALRVSPGGEVLGVDISPAMIQAAQRLDGPGQRTVRFRLADAQTDELGHGFDAAYARFSVMFFADHVAGLSNIRQALRPGARLACLTWGPLRANPWMYVPKLAAAPLLGRELSLPGPDDPDPFDLSDPDVTANVLAQAGFVDVAVEHLVGSRFIAADAAREEITALMEEGGPLVDLWATAGPTTREACLEAIIESLAPYSDNGGWRLPGSALCATAAVGCRPRARP
jgi:SAM-dependent methyltransferase